MVNRLDPDTALLVLDPVDDAVTAAPGGMAAGELEVQRSPDAMRVVSERTVDELGDSGDDLLREPSQVALGCR
jgi:hypothetical protein